MGVAFGIAFVRRRIRSLWRVPHIKNFINYQAGNCFETALSYNSMECMDLAPGISFGTPCSHQSVAISLKVFMATIGGEIYIKIVNFSYFPSLPSSRGSRTLLFMLLIMRSGTTNMFNMRFMLFMEIVWLRRAKAKPCIGKGWRHFFQCFEHFSTPRR